MIHIQNQLRDEAMIVSEMGQIYEHYGWESNQDIKDTPTCILTLRDDLVWGMMVKQAQVLLKLRRI